MTEAIPGRGHHGRFARTPEGAERDAEVMRLKTLGLTFTQIGEQMGYADASGAYKAYKRALAAVPVEAVTELRGTALARLDLATRKVMEVIARRHLHVASSGRVATDPGTGEVLLDDGPLLAAIDRLVKIEERRSRLLGLDAPAKVDMAVSDETDRTIEAIFAEMRAEMRAEVEADVRRELLSGVVPGEVVAVGEES